MSYIQLKKGSISVDFIFSFVGIILLTLFLFFITWTLCLIEVSQYITYASAREYFISHKNLNQHHIKAQEKFNDLKNTFFPPRMSNWFDLNLKALRAPSGVLNSDLFVGIRAELNAKILDIDIPLIGKTLPHGGGFKIEVASFLGREESIEECKVFFNSQYRTRVQNLTTSININPSIPDQIANGC